MFCDRADGSWILKSTGLVLEDISSFQRNQQISLFSKCKAELLLLWWTTVGKINSFLQAAA